MEILYINVIITIIIIMLAMTMPLGVIERAMTVCTPPLITGHRKVVVELMLWVDEWVYEVFGLLY